MTERKIPPKNESLLVHSPELCEDWDYINNYPARPEHYRPYSETLVWWKCHTCGYSWVAQIKNRTLGNGCPKHWKRVEYRLKMV